MNSNTIPACCIGETPSTLIWCHSVLFWYLHTNKSLVIKLMKNSHKTLHYTLPNYPLCIIHLNNTCMLHLYSDAMLFSPFFLNIYIFEDKALRYFTWRKTSLIIKLWKTPTRHFSTVPSTEVKFCLLRCMLVCHLRISKTKPMYYFPPLVVYYIYTYFRLW